MTPDGESRARGPGSQGIGSPTTARDITPAKRPAVIAMVTRAVAGGGS